MSNNQQQQIKRYYKRYEDCDEKIPYCSVGNDGVGICGLNDPPSPTASPIVKPKIPARCDTDDQCFARLRTAISRPSNICVGLCEVSTSG